MPARQKTRVRRGRPAVLRPRRARRYPRRRMAFPQPRRRHPRRGWPQAMLVLGAVVFAALLTAALALTASGHDTCARPMGTACLSPPSRSVLRSAAEADARRAEMTGAAAQLARPMEPGCGRSAPGFRAAALPALPGCQQIAEGGAQLPRSRRPGLFRSFGLDGGRHCLDAFLQPAAAAGSRISREFRPAGPVQRSR